MDANEEKVRKNSDKKAKHRAVRDMFGLTPAKPNRDERRVRMYAAYAERGEAVPFHLANDESELSKWA